VKRMESRPVKRKCENCRSWTRWDDKSEWGECRRYPQQQTKEDASWCNEFRPQRQLPHAFEVVNDLRDLGAAPTGVGRKLQRSWFLNPKKKEEGSE